MIGKGEQLKGRAEQAVGKATGSEETQARGEVDEATSNTRERVADAEGAVMKVDDEAKKKIAKIKANARAAIDGLLLLP